MKSGKVIFFFSFNFTYPLMSTRKSAEIGGRTSPVYWMFLWLNSCQIEMKVSIWSLNLLKKFRWLPESMCCLSNLELLLWHQYYFGRAVSNISYHDQIQAIQVWNRLWRFPRLSKFRYEYLLELSPGAVEKFTVYRCSSNW